MFSLPIPRTCRAMRRNFWITTSRKSDQEFYLRDFDLTLEEKTQLIFCNELISMSDSFIDLTTDEPVEPVGVAHFESDLALAIRLQTEENQRVLDSKVIECKDSSSSVPSQIEKGAIVAPELEVVDPTPDIHALFRDFNREFFDGKLDSVEVKWSSRMTLCAGLCSYEGRGGLCSIRLSEKLLQFRPRSDLVNTLLHECIHAYEFIVARVRDRDGHGPRFQAMMNSINQRAGTNITIYHNFKEEVNIHRNHWWKCSGVCQHRPPYFGVVKRAMNRAPSHNDSWWAAHQRSCGGSFLKIREPDGYSKGTKRKRAKSEERANQEPSLLKGQRRIDSMFKRK